MSDIEWTVEAPSDIDYATPALEAADPERVSWHMRMARSIQRQIDEVNDLADAETKRVEEWREDRTSVLRNRLAWHSAPIRSYHEMVMTEDSKRKTLHTPHGRSKIKVPTKPNVWIADKDAVTDWATESLPAIVKRSVLVSDLRRAVTVDGDRAVHPETGEVVPGVTVDVPLPSWSLDLDDGEPL